MLSPYTLRLITRILITTLAILVVARFVPGVTIEGFYSALIVAFILGLFNVTIKPLLIILTLPITILTMGLFIFVINGLLFMFAASFIQGFSVSSFWVALLASLLVSAISTVLNSFLVRAK